MENFRKVSIIPIEDEQIIAEVVIARKLSQQLEKENISTIHVNHETEPPSYEPKDLRHFKDDRHHHHHHHEGHYDHKHHDHHKHHAHHNHHKHLDQHQHDEDRQINYGGHHKHEKKHKKFQGRPPNEKLDPNGPKDKFYFVRIMFFILGIIHILPFTFFMTANEYWMYKFRNTSIENSTDANDRTYLQKNFQSLNHLITMGPSTVCQFLLTFFGHKITTNTRTMFTLVLHSLVFVLQTIFVKINTDDWQVGFFCLTVGFMTLISCSMSLGSTGNMVTISQFPDQYLKMYLVGESVAALITAIMRLISIVVAPTTIGSAWLYFITGSIMMIIPTILYHFSTKLAFFRYYTRNMKKSTRKRIPRLPEFKDILSYTWPILLLAVISMLIPHASVGSLVVSEYYGTNSLWGTKYFVTCCTYLLPALCGIIGRGIFYKFEYIMQSLTIYESSTAASVLLYPMHQIIIVHSIMYHFKKPINESNLFESRWFQPVKGYVAYTFKIFNPPMKVLYIVHFTRELVYTPLVLFVNAKPRKHLPVLFPHDWQYALIVGSQALITGYTSNMASMKSLRLVPKERLELSWLVNMFVMKIISIAASPMGLLVTNNIL